MLGEPSLPLSHLEYNYLVDAEKVRKFQPLEDYACTPKTEQSLAVEKKDSNNTALTLLPWGENVEKEAFSLPLVSSEMGYTNNNG